MDITQFLEVLREIVVSDKELADYLTNHEEDLIAMNLAVWVRDKKHNNDWDTTWLSTCYRFTENICNGHPYDLCPFRGEIQGECEGFPYHYTQEELGIMNTETAKSLLKEKKLTYKEYLLTLHWKKVRDLLVEKSGGKCQLCNNKYYLNVHHKTYDHLGDEQSHIEDLIVLCKNCHTTFHKKLCITKTQTTNQILDKPTNKINITPPSDLSSPEDLLKFHEIHLHKYRKNSKAYQKSLEAITRLMEGCFFNSINGSFTKYHNKKFTADEITMVIIRIYTSINPHIKQKYLKGPFDTLVYNPYANSSRNRSQFIYFFEHGPMNKEVTQ